MQVFEFHFNPLGRRPKSEVKDVILDSFCYEPENIYEKRVGSLYMVGMLKNVLPQNVRFLEKLAKVIKGKYYSTTLVKPEKSLKNSLKEANDFLESIAKRGDVSWLGNLSFGVIAIKNYELNFTKVGGLKFFLIRKGRIIDIDQKLKLEEIEPYPLKIFGNIVSGKLNENDVIVALTKDALETFRSQNLIQEIAQIAPAEEKRIKEIFNDKQEILSKISGVCLLILLADELRSSLPFANTRVNKECQSSIAREVISPKPVKFSFKKFLAPILNYIFGLKNLIKKPEFKIKKPEVKIKKPEFKKPAIRIPRPSLPKLPQIPKVSQQWSKNLILIFALVVFLAVGFFIAQREKERKIEDYQQTLREIEAKVDEAESYLLLKETLPEAGQKANSLLKDSWNEISPLSKIVETLPSLKDDILALKDVISKDLYQLNKLEMIEEPEILFEFDKEKFVPQKIIAVDDKLYFFNTFSEDIFLITGSGVDKEIIEINKKFQAATALDDAAVFFSAPDQLVILSNGEIESFSLQHLSDFDYEFLSSYRSGLYFLDKNKGEITKYPYLENFVWGAPQFWLAPQAKRITNAKSFAVDGSIWFLDQDNSLTRYYGGWPQETINVELFPAVKNFSKIISRVDLPYLYLLEPEQSRVVILNKAGQILQQFQSPQFDNLLDFAVAKDGKTIYLLNELKVYQIKI